MSEYIDNFILDHEDYFKNNEEYLKSSNWNLITYVEENVKSHEEINGDKHKQKLSSVKSDYKLVKNTLNRLSVFIKESASDRHLAKTQKFIDYTASIINIYLDRCNRYLKESKTKSIETPYIKDLEVEFQDILFNNKVDISDALGKLNIADSTENIKIEFFKDQKAPLTMSSILPLVNKDVEIKSEKISFNWDVLSSNEMLINMKLKDIPRWNHKKHYWEQDPVTLAFWQEERIKITQGFNIGGYFMHPWLYWHLNYFKTKIPKPDGTEPVINPYLRDNEWFIVENLKVAEDAGDKGLLLYGTRRMAKSVFMASYLMWKAHTKPNASATITSGSESDLNELTGKIQKAMLYLEPAFKLEIQKQEWSGGDVILGLKADASNIIEHSRISIKNMVAGQTRASQKTAGGDPSAFIIEEIGKFAFLLGYLAALPSFETPTGFKCVPILVGTGGEADLSADAMKVLANPELYNLLPMDWDLLENKIDPEYITWKRRNFATFVPGQMAYKKGFIKNEEKLSDFLGIQSKELQKLTIQVTNWKENGDAIQKLIDDASTDKIVQQQRRVQYPLDPDDCFISTIGNPFPVKEAQATKNFNILNGDIGKKVFLTVNSMTHKIEANFAEDSPLAAYPHAGGFIDCPVLLFEDLPEVKPPSYMYVAGFDDYKQEESTTSPSVGTLYIKKIDLLGLGRFTNQIVASISTRPDPHGKMHRQWMLLLEAFNCKAFGENEDMDFKKYTDRSRKTDMLLVESMDFNSDMQITYGGRRKYGWKPDDKNIPFLFGLFVQWTKTEITIIDKFDNETTVLGIQTIKDIALLDEIISYKVGNNVDRITAMMGAMGYEFFLYVNYMFPRIESKVKSTEVEKYKKEQNKNLAQRMFKTMPNQKPFQGRR